MTEPAAKPRRTRRLLLVVGVLGVLGGSAFLAYRAGWFFRDHVNEAEAANLRTAALKGTPAAAATAGWPQWRGPARNGEAPAGPLRTDWDTNPPKKAWSSPCGGGYSSLAVVGGRVYTQDRQGDNERVFCLDSETGQPVWEFAYPADYAGTDRSYAVGPRATPSVEGNRVYTVGAAGTLLCLEAPPAPGAAPRVVWRHDLLTEFGSPMPQWGVAGSPLVEGELVIVQLGGKDAAVLAFEKETGTLKWKAGSNPAGYSSPVAATVGSVRLVFALTGDALLCLRAADGKVLSSYPWKTDHQGNIATPLVIDDYVFISSAYSRGCALLRVAADGDARRLECVYERKGRVMRNHHATSVYRDGFLYGYDGTRSTTLKCVDFRELKEVESWESNKAVDSGTLILAGRHLLIQTERGDVALVAADPTDFKLVATLRGVLDGQLNWALPVLVGGRLYLRDGGKVVCLDVRP